MKVLGIAGSNRSNGNTAFYVRHALERLEAEGFETEYISLAKKDINPCLGCYSCVEAKTCTQKGDDFHAIFDKMVAAEGLIVASPVYYSSVVPQLMALLDRAGFCRRWDGEFFSGKVGGPITVARRAGHNMAFAQLLLWYFINDIIVPGSSYWNVGLAGSGGGIDASEDEEGIKTIDHFCDNMARVMRALNK